MKQYDKERIYCRRLGHWLSFTYCRQEKNGLPCFKIMDCWFGKLPIEDFLKENFKEGEISYIFKPPKQKITSIIELIEQAKNRTNKNS